VVMMLTIQQVLIMMMMVQQVAMMMMQDMGMRSNVPDMT